MCGLAVDALKSLGEVHAKSTSASVGDDKDANRVQTSADGEDPRPNLGSSTNSSMAYSLKWLTASSSLERLNDAVASVNKYDQLFLNLCQCGVDNFTQIGRKRTASKMVYEMGCLHFSRGKDEAAAKYLKKAARTFAAAHPTTTVKNREVDIFQMRCYIFAQQAAMLMRLDDPVSARVMQLALHCC